MAYFEVNGVSYSADFKTGSGCSVTLFEIAGSKFSTKYVSLRATGGNYADGGNGFTQNSTEVRTLVGDNDYVSQQNTVGVGGGGVGMDRQIP